MKILYFIFIIISALVLVFLFADIMIGYLSYRNIFQRNGKMRKKFEKIYQQDKRELKDFSNAQLINIVVEDNTKIEAIYQDNNSSKLVLIVHGYGQDKQSLHEWSKLFKSIGFDELLIDLYFDGGVVDGKTIQYENNNINLWLDKAKGLKDYSQIVLMGLGIGGTIVMGILPQKDNRVKAIICDSCFDNTLKQVMFLNSKKKFKSKFFMKIFLNYLIKNKKINLKKLDNCELLKQSKIPILILHGENDKITPVEMAYNLYASLPEKLSQINVFKNSGHLESIKTNNYLYKNEIKNFLNKYNI